MNNSPKDLTKLSDKELHDLWDKTSKEALAAKEENKRVANEVAARETAASAQQVYDKLSDPERAALAQVMSVEGIESKESVNG